MFFSVSIKQIINSYTQIWKNKLLTLLPLLFAQIKNLM
ncbi:hypothetical protein EH2_03053 [Bacillus subtilis]|uniref:Uncharacterized protein n=1 Tax=Bacillus subtilis TaxID=1423 RepID=A0AAP1H801_BACIU|nr:hypothetical protein B4146_1551 [Bacillus subtilis]KZD87137.1 hypothetical protein B4122_4644 [Bacillus subtilis]RPK17743.1 hypothetical protein EH2_03053 [Bacillus subtilis]